MARKKNLREFQENLAKRLAEAQVSNHRTLLAVETQNMGWLIDLTDTGEVLPVPTLTRVPLTRRWLRGIANVRGVLHGVIDFAAFHGDPLTPLTGRSRLILLSNQHQHSAGTALLFSQTSGLRRMEEFDADHGSRPEHPWVSEALRDMWDRQWLKLDVNALAAAPEFLDVVATATP